MPTVGGYGANRRQARAARFRSPCRRRPRRTCVFTFTNKAAGEIAERLQSELGASAELVKRGTIHSFCAELLREFGDQIGLQLGFGIADDDNQTAVLRKLKVPRKLTKPI